MKSTVKASLGTSLYKLGLYGYLCSLGASILLIFVLFLSDFYSSALFVIKSLSYHLCISLIFSNTSFAIFLALAFKKKPYLFVPVSFALLAIILSQYSFNRAGNDLDGHFNVVSFSALSRTGNGDDIDQYLRKDPPEILCLQEAFTEGTDNLSQYYDYIYQHPNKALLVASDWPISPIETANGVQLSKLDTIYGGIWLVNVHMSRQYRSKEIDADWNSLIDITKSDGPMIICGDFNLTPYNSMYEKFTEQLGFSDSHEKAQGFGFTFPYRQRRIALFGTMLRIDYILARGLEFSASKTFAISELSDHKAVIASLRVE